MANARPKVAYGLSQPYFAVGPIPIVVQRDPTISDFAEIGSTWINTLTNSVWTLTNIIANQAVWTETDNTNVNLGITWHTIAGVGPVALAPNNGYYLQDPLPTALTLPLVATLGSQIYIATLNASAANAGFTIAQNPGQYILVGDDSSAIGAGGSLLAINDLQRSITMQLICTIANTEFTVFSTNINPNLV